MRGARGVNLRLALAFTCSYRSPSVRSIATKRHAIAQKRSAKLGKLELLGRMLRAKKTKTNTRKQIDIQLPNPLFDRGALLSTRGDWCRATAKANTSTDLTLAMQFRISSSSAVAMAIAATLLASLAAPAAAAASAYTRPLNADCVSGSLASGADGSLYPSQFLIQGDSMTNGANYTQARPGARWQHARCPPVSAPVSAPAVTLLGARARARPPASADHRRHRFQRQVLPHLQGRGGRGLTPLPPLHGAEPKFEQADALVAAVLCPPPHHHTHRLSTTPRLARFTSFASAAPPAPGA